MTLNISWGFLPVCPAQNKMKMIVIENKEPQMVFRYQEVQVKPRLYSSPHPFAVALGKFPASLYSQVYALCDLL